jgi:hypothetical protein
MFALKKLFEEVELNLLIVGNTKFSMDRYFGYGKKKSQKHRKIRIN